MWKLILIFTVVAGDSYAARNDGNSYAPDLGFPYIDPTEYHRQLTEQILAQQRAQNRAFVSTYVSNDGFASAGASLLSNDELFQKQFSQHQAFLDNIQQQAEYYQGAATHGNEPNFASASGSIGPGGVHQTASVYPENPKVPNLDSRFATNSAGEGDQFHGVSVSSYSSSSDINGQKTSNRGAVTTVNDNGKVTTYRVHS